MESRAAFLGHEEHLGSCAAPVTVLMFGKTTMAPITTRMRTKRMMSHIY